MKKITQILFFLFLSVKLHAQKDLVVISATQYDIVYRNVPNLIRIGFANMNSFYYVECQGGNITNVDSTDHFLPENNFIVIPGAWRKMIIRLYDSSDTLTRKMLSEHHFINSDLPSPELFFGAARSGDAVYWKENKLFAKYPPEILLDYKFKIIRWKAEIKGNLYEGEGNTLSVEFQNAIKKLKAEKEFTITVDTIGEDKLERTVTSVFKRAPDEWCENLEDEFN